MGGPTPDRFVGGPRRQRLRAPHAVLAAALLLGGAAAPMTVASAASDAEAQGAANTVAQASNVPSGWTGSSASCSAGTESQASLDATLQAVNAFRAVAGLPAAALDPALNEKALSAALMMRAGNELGNDRGLDHAPDPAWPCYSALGASGAATSNLALGSSGAEAIGLYVADEDVTSLGHRRWVLDPAILTLGTGSTGASNALTVIGGARTTVAPGTQVPWPPAGAISATWLPSTWSISVGGSGEAVTFTDPQVAMALDGAPVSVSGITDLGTGYGTGRALSWMPALGAGDLGNGSHRIDVSITGVAIGGISTPISYATTIGPPPPAIVPAPTPTPTAAAPTTPTPNTASRLRPRIVKPRGKARIGSKLTATFAQGTGRIVTQVQWLRSGAPIKRANSVRYRVSRKDRGRTLRVRVTSQTRGGGSVVTEQSAGLKIRR